MLERLHYLTTYLVEKSVKICWRLERSLLMELTEKRSRDLLHFQPTFSKMIFCSRPWRSESAWNSQLNSNLRVQWMRKWQESKRQSGTWDWTSAKTQKLEDLLLRESQEEKEREHPLELSSLLILTWFSWMNLPLDLIHSLLLQSWKYWEI